MSDFVILVCAAGSSSRMAPDDKLLLEIGGVPMIRRIVDRCCELDAQTWVALRDGTDARAKALADTPSFRWVFGDSAEGLSGTLRAAAERLQGNASHVMIVHADMPDIGIAHLARMRMAPRDFPDAKIWRAKSADGTVGHPVVFDASLFAEFANLQGDDGAKAIIAAHQSDCVDIIFAGDATTTDIDTKDDWISWKTGP